MNILKKINKLLNNNEFICLIFIILIIILIIGTLAQKEIGIKSVKEIYFNSLFIKNNFFIIPGIKLLLFLFCINLINKLFFYKNKIDSFLIHFGFLLFIIFSFFFSNLNEEKYISLNEDQKCNFLIDNNKLDLEISHKSLKKIKTLNLLKDNHLDYIFFNNFYFKIKKFSINSNLIIINNLNKKNYFKIIKSKSFVENNYDKSFIEIEFFNSFEKKKKNYI